MRLARHEPVADEGVHEAGDRARRHVQRLGKNALRHGAASADLPEQMGARQRETQALESLRHVVVQQNGERENAIQESLVLL
jgi:hypothetical protein